MVGGEPKDGGGEVRVDISRLPLPGSDLVGRDDETKSLDACWSERAHVATIVAPGGVGKSTLVWSWVQRMLADGWRGAERVYAWSFYSQGANDQQVSTDPFVHAALTWLGDADPSAGGPWEKVDRLVAAIRARRTLLVLDGLEPLQWASGPEVEKLTDKPLSLLVWRLAEQNPGLCVITSRLPVRDVGDFAKEKSRRLDLGKLSDEAGKQLLRARGVVGTKKHIATYQQDMPKLIGVDMEGGGVATAVHNHRVRPRFLMIRGVSDLADGEGNAAMKLRWRAYARDVAAAYTLGLLMEGPVPAARR